MLMYDAVDDRAVREGLISFADAVAMQKCV